MNNLTLYFISGIIFYILSSFSLLKNTEEIKEINNFLFFTAFLITSILIILIWPVLLLLKIINKFKKII